MKDNQIDPHMPAAWGARPLFRLRLIDRENTEIGYELMDVIAIYPREKTVLGDFVWFNEAYAVLALGSNGKWTMSLITNDQMEDLDKCYEVVK
jgi:hypothetical protein